MLSGPAFNALLKTLEEPPAHVKFLFATTEAHKLPATIISRCQRFDLQPIRDEVAASHLLAIAKQEKVKLDPAAAEVIARAAEGGMRDAESMLDQVVSFCGEKVTEQDVLSIFGFASADDVAALAGHILSGNAAAALDLVAAQSDSGKDLGRLLSDLVAMARDLLVTEVTGKEVAGRRGDLLTPMRGLFTPRKLTELLEILSAAEAGLRYSPDKKLPLELAVIKGIQLLHTADLDEVLDALAGLRGGELPAPRPAPRAAAPAPAPAAVAKPAEKKSAPPPAADGADPRKVWQGVVEEVVSRHAIRSAWLERVQEVNEEEGILRVVFPADQEKLLKTPVVKEHGTLIEELWKKATGRRISFRPEATGEVVAVAPRASASAPLADDFENDPGIEAAIELFGATLEPDEAKQS